MSTTRFNILEQVILEMGVIPGADHGPRLLVIRNSLSPFHLKNRLHDLPESPGFPHSAILHSEEQRDWTSVFRLDPLANNPQREVIELVSSCYSDRRRNSHIHITFSFSVPVPTQGGHIFYGKSDWGLLAAHDFLCSFEGTFGAPESIAYLTLGRS